MNKAKGLGGVLFLGMYLMIYNAIVTTVLFFVLAWLLESQKVIDGLFFLRNVYSWLVGVWAVVMSLCIIFEKKEK